jgi:hypothetical protein
VIVVLMDTINESIQKISDYEGYSLDIATQKFNERKNLPSTVFCGPSKTYPADTPESTIESFKRLTSYAHRLSPAVREKTLTSLKRKAQRFSVSTDETVEFALQVLETPQEQINAIVERFILSEVPKQKTVQTTDPTQVTEWYEKLIRKGK